MLEIIKSIFESLFKADFAMLVVVVLALNVFLTGVRKALEIIKDKTESDIDNKIYNILGKVTDVLLKIIDVIGSNPQHK